MINVLTVQDTEVTSPVHSSISLNSAPGSLNIVPHSTIIIPLPYSVIMGAGGTI